jgi:hypothetical protein
MIIMRNELITVISCKISSVLHLILYLRFYLFSIFQDIFYKKRAGYHPCSIYPFIHFSLSCYLSNN